MTTTTNPSQASANAAYVMNANGDVKVIVASKKEEEKNNPAKPLAGFAKNKRYSIYNNGGGYSGL